eukprot:346741_1
MLLSLQIMMITLTVSQNISNPTHMPAIFHTTKFYHTTELSCDGFFCQISNRCINTTMVCNGIADCEYNEDEPKECRVCIRITYEPFGGPFEYLSYDINTRSIIYNNSLNNYYLYSDEYKYYISTNYTDFAHSDVYCILKNSSTTSISDCTMWYITNGDVPIMGYSLDIGCRECDGFTCSRSGICIDESDICDSEKQCAVHDEAKLCNICFQIDGENYQYLNANFSYEKFDTMNNGIIYSDDSSLYMYPVKYQNPVNNFYIYSYMIYTDYNETMYPFAICTMNLTSYKEIIYITLRIEYCIQWYVADYEIVDWVKVNITWQYCPDTQTTITP